MVNIYLKRGKKGWSVNCFVNLGAKYYFSKIGCSEFSFLKRMSLHKSEFLSFGMFRIEFMLFDMVNICHMTRFLFIYIFFNFCFPCLYIYIYIIEIFYLFIFS